MSALMKKAATAWDVFHTRGLMGVASVTTQKIGMWWRTGEVWELGRLVGRPSRVVRLDGCKFSIDERAVPAELINLLLLGEHEKPEREALKRHFNPRLPVVEFGGCIGVVACLTNRRLENPERHVVVEANPRMLPLLEENRERNRCRFTVLHRAVAYESDEVTFHISENVLASSVQLSTAQKIRVPATTLEGILDEYGFDRCTLICDIEGGEIALVENEADTLRERVATIVVEVHHRLVGADTTDGMLRRLEQIGFRKVFQDWDTHVFENVSLAAAAMN